MARADWFKHGFWNLLEHLVTRGADAGAVFVLVWVLPTEMFSRLAFAQAVVSAWLILFFSPEVILSRDLMAWKQEGLVVLASRLRMLRRFGWMKWGAALVLALGLAAFRAEGVSFFQRFCAYGWAFTLALMTQVSGIDREFLRRELRLRELNVVTLYQKLAFLAGTVGVAWIWPQRIDVLAGVAGLVLVSTSLLTVRYTRRLLEEMGSERAARSPHGARTSLREALSLSLNRYSLWVHVGATLSGWVQTMDLFVLGLVGLSSREAGLYAFVLKLANFSVMAPMALGNLFSLWVTRQPRPDWTLETATLRRVYPAFAAMLALQALVLWALAPYVIALFSHGRWTQEEQVQMRSWLGWILAGTSLGSLTLLARGWMVLRYDMMTFCARVHLPWWVASLAIYFVAAAAGGASGAAVANVAVGLLVIALLAAYAHRALRSPAISPWDAPGPATPGTGPGAPHPPN